MTESDARKTVVDEAARKAAERMEMAKENPEPSLGWRFGQIGILGWMIVIPVLLALLAGHWMDRLIGSGLVITAALTVLGAALGLWLAVRWMHDQ